MVAPNYAQARSQLAKRESKAVSMLDNGGLMPLATGAQVRIANGQLSVTDGPFVEAKEVIGGYAIFELRDKDEAFLGTGIHAAAQRPDAGLGRDMRGACIRRLRRHRHLRRKSANPRRRS